MPAGEDSKRRDFYELTYQGRARRLRAMAAQALAEYSLPVTGIRLITIETNGIFRVDVEDGRRFILRISDPKGSHEAAEIRSEIAWMDALSRETDLCIPVPVRNLSGEFLTMARTKGVPEERCCVLFSWIRGRDLAEKVNPETMTALGEVTAQLHIHGTQFQPPHGFRVRTLDSVFPYADPEFKHIEPVVLFGADPSPLLSTLQQDLFRRGAEIIQHELDRLYGAGGAPGLLHGDLHRWNVKVFRGRLAVLDFEDLMWGYPIQDIGTTWMYFYELPGAEQLLEAYRQGYTRRLPWPETWPGQLEVMIAARIYNLVNYLLVSPVPEDQQAAPLYVQRSITRLEKLLAL